MAVCSLGRSGNEENEFFKLAVIASVFELSSEKVKSEEPSPSKSRESAERESEVIDVVPTEEDVVGM